VSVTEYRDQGYAPEAVLNYLARFGWSYGDKEVFSKKELTLAFSWENCGRGDGKFDAKKFLAIDFEHLKSEALVREDEYVRRVTPFLAKNGLEGVDEGRLRRAIKTIRGRARTFVEAADMLDYYFREPPRVDETAAAKHYTAAAAPILKGFRDAIAGADPWDETTLEERTHAWLTTSGVAIKDLGQPARVALTGRTASPGLYEVLAVLGRETSLKRVDTALARAQAAPGGA
jgi:glutamyl-tRNA synthetase